MKRDVYEFRIFLKHRCGTDEGGFEKRRGTAI
jgi:hypothetical protein